MTVTRDRVAAVLLLRPDGAVLMQHRDEKPGLPHAGMWTPPGGHCEADEPMESCARREFLEETDYRCTDLRWLADMKIDDIPHAPAMTLSVFWTFYDGVQSYQCHEGQALAFVPRAGAERLPIPSYIRDLWDAAIAASRVGDAESLSRSLPGSTSVPGDVNPS